MKIIYEDENVQVFDKPAGVNSDDFPKRVHRLDKDTSGIFIVAKDDKTLEFLQKQFKERKVKKKYLVLAVGHLKNETGKIETLIGRSPSDRRKQKVYLEGEPGVEKNYRKAITKYRVLQRFSAQGGSASGGENYDLVEAELLTGRKHQIRTHFAHLGHPIAGDKLYGFKGQIRPDNLKRQFLHASYLKIEMPNGREREFKSELPQDLKETLNNLRR